MYMLSVLGPNLRWFPLPERPRRPDGFRGRPDEERRREGEEGEEEGEEGEDQDERREDD